jgi:oligosaccharyltransferase complex subunit alpha (ribophorin I)
VTLASSNIESFSKLKPTSQSEATITYGPYSNVEPFSFDAMTVHFENNNPFLVVTKLERAIELSMWGNIAVEETLDVRHSGAKLKGPFSRYEFQRESSGVSSVKSFKTVLPASGFYFRFRQWVETNPSNICFFPMAIHFYLASWYHAHGLRMSVYGC